MAFPSPQPQRHLAFKFALALGLMVALPTAPADPNTMREKISGELKQAFPFKPESENENVLDENEAILMAPVTVLEKPLPRGLEPAMAQKRAELSSSFNLKDGGVLIKDTIGGFTVEAKPHQEMIPTKVGAENPIPRWTLLRKSW